MSISRDELLAQGKRAFAEAVRPYHIDDDADAEDFDNAVAAVIAVVLAAGEKRWHCAEYDDYTDVPCWPSPRWTDSESRHRELCGWVVVLPVWEEGK